jgi:hypothetical protein
MEACQRIDSCPMFKAFTLKSSLKVWQTLYCEGDFSRCARYRLAMEGQRVAVNLLPNGRTFELPLEQLTPDHLN